MSNSSDPDQARCSVGPDLGPNCLPLLLIEALVDNESIISRERAQSYDDLRDDFTTKLIHALSHVCFPSFCPVPRRDTATNPPLS